MDHSTAPLGQVIEAAREAAGLGKNQTADLAGIPRTTYKRLAVTGDFPYSHLRRLSAVLGISTQALVDAAEEAA